MLRYRKLIERGDFLEISGLPTDQRKETVLAKLRQYRLIEENGSRYVLQILLGSIGFVELCVVLLRSRF